MNQFSTIVAVLMGGPHCGDTFHITDSVYYCERAGGTYERQSWKSRAGHVVFKIKPRRKA